MSAKMQNPVSETRDRCFRYGSYHKDGTFLGIEVQGRRFAYDEGSDDPRPVAGTATQIMLTEDKGSHYVVSTLRDLEINDIRVINALNDGWHEPDGFRELVECFRDEGLVEDVRPSANHVVDLAAEAMANLMEENDADTFALWDIETLRRRVAQARKLREEARIMDHQVRRRTRVTSQRVQHHPTADTLTLRNPR